MELGFALITHEPASDLVSLVTSTEEMGYEFAWIADQTFFYDPFPILAAAGLRTERLGLGVGVTNPYTRHPVQVARTMATISDLVGRPITLGIGAGNRRMLLEPLGHEQRSPVERCQEMALLVRRLVRGEEVTYESESLTLQAVKLDFHPSQPVPIFVAGRGPKMLQMAGEVADGVIIGDLISDTGLDYAMDKIGEGAKAAGRPLEDIKLVAWATCYVTNGDYRETVNRLRPWVALHMVGSPPSVQRALGVEEDRITAIRTVYAERGIEAAAAYIKPEDVEQLTIVGTPEKCAATVRRLVDRGVDQLGMLVYPEEVSECRDVLTSFAHEVMPLLN